jgi:predicted RNA-binding Zn ribbon-like protein
MVMAKRQDAPGELERVRAFVNTVDLEPGEEQLTDPLALGAWLTDSGLASDLDPPSERDLRHAVELREALRAILLTHSEPSVADPAAGAILDQTARRARLGLRFDERGVGRLEPDSDGVDAALGRLLAIVDRAIEHGTWERLKACREHTCAWAFYDHTKNRSGSWCNMADCGNRAKAKAYRERRSGANVGT